MILLTTIIFLISLLGLLIGLIAPQEVLGKGLLKKFEPRRGNVLKVYGSALLLSFIGSMALVDPVQPSNNPTTQNVQAQGVQLKAKNVESTPEKKQEKPVDNPPTANLKVHTDPSVNNLKLVEPTKETPTVTKEQATPPPVSSEQSPKALTSPNGTYTNSDGNKVPSPYYAPSAPAGASARCRDGTYSLSQSRRGTCSHHGGVAEWLP